MNSGDEQPRLSSSSPTDDASAATSREPLSCSVQNPEPTTERRNRGNGEIRGASSSSKSTTNSEMCAAKVPIHDVVHVESLENYLIYDVQKISSARYVIPHFLFLLFVTFVALAPLHPNTHRFRSGPPAVTEVFDRALFGVQSGDGDGGVATGRRQQELSVHNHNQSVGTTNGTSSSSSSSSSSRTVSVLKPSSVGEAVETMKRFVRTVTQLMSTPRASSSGRFGPFLRDMQFVGVMSSRVYREVPLSEADKDTSSLEARCSVTGGGKAHQLSSIFVGSPYERRLLGERKCVGDDGVAHGPERMSVNGTTYHSYGLQQTNNATLVGGQPQEEFVAHDVLYFGGSRPLEGRLRTEGYGRIPYFTGENIFQIVETSATANNSCSCSSRRVPILVLSSVDTNSSSTFSESLASCVQNATDMTEGSNTTTAQARIDASIAERFGCLVQVFPEDIVAVVLEAVVYRRQGGLGGSRQGGSEFYLIQYVFEQRKSGMSVGLHYTPFSVESPGDSVVNMAIVVAELLLIGFWILFVVELVSTVRMNYQLYSISGLSTLLNTTQNDESHDEEVADEQDEGCCTGNAFRHFFASITGWWEFYDVIVILALGLMLWMRYSSFVRQQEVLTIGESYRSERKHLVRSLYQPTHNNSYSSNEQQHQLQAFDAKHKTHLHEALVDVAVVSNDYLSVAGWLVMIAFLRTFKYSRFSVRMSIINQTIGTAVHEVLGVLIVLTLVFVAFAISGVLIFGHATSEANDFQNFQTALIFLFVTLLNGEPNTYYGYEKADRTSAMLYFFAFYLLGWLLLLNVVVGVIAMSFASVTETNMMVERARWSFGSIAKSLRTLTLRLNPIFWCRQWKDGDDRDTDGQGKEKKEEQLPRDAATSSLIWSISVPSERFSAYCGDRIQFLHLLYVWGEQGGLLEHKLDAGYVSLGTLLRRSRNSPHFSEMFVRMVFMKSVQQIGTENGRKKQERLHLSAINNSKLVKQRLQKIGNVLQKIYERVCIQKQTVVTRQLVPHHRSRRDHNLLNAAGGGRKVLGKLHLNLVVLSRMLVAASSSTTTTANHSMEEQQQEQRTQRYYTLASGLLHEQRLLKRVVENMEVMRRIRGVISADDALSPVFRGMQGTDQERSDSSLLLSRRRSSGFSSGGSGGGGLHLRNRVDRYFSPKFLRVGQLESLSRYRGEIRFEVHQSVFYKVSVGVFQLLKDYCVGFTSMRLAHLDERRGILEAERNEMLKKSELKRAASVEMLLTLKQQHLSSANILRTGGKDSTTTTGCKGEKEEEQRQGEVHAEGTVELTKEGGGNQLALKDEEEEGQRQPQPTSRVASSPPSSVPFRDFVEDTEGTWPKLANPAPHLLRKMNGSQQAEGMDTAIEEGSWLLMNPICSSSVGVDLARARQPSSGMIGNSVTENRATTKDLSRTSSSTVITSPRRRTHTNATTTKMTTNSSPGTPTTAAAAAASITTLGVVASKRSKKYDPRASPK